MRYVDGFLIAVPKRKLPLYKKIARAAGTIWKKHGAVEYVESIGDDLDIKGVVSFKKSARAGKGDAVIFSFIVYKSRRHRDQVNKKVMADPRFARMMEPAQAAFDPKRIAYSGFKVFVDR